MVAPCCRNVRHREINSARSLSRHKEPIFICIPPTPPPNKLSLKCVTYMLTVNVISVQHGAVVSVTMTMGLRATRHRLGEQTDAIGALKLPQCRS